MTSRFHIEDLIVQDASGVVFRAKDSETGRMVAIRRFFPFGVDGGGLHDDEQTAYRIALGRLTGIHHPALRSVVGGGCDPVDGMPYIVTEWVEGEALDVVMAGNPLPVEAATLLISQALEVSELLSHVLAEEAVWVETTLDTIVVSQPESGRGFTFWISPLKWLGHGGNRGIESIITLAEDAMGWQGRIVNEQAGRGLGAWIKWLRAAAPTTSLHEVREMLAASVGDEPPPPAKTLAIQASAPVRPVKQPSTKGPLIATLCGIVVVGAAVAWFLAGKQKAGSATTPIAAASSVPTPPKAVASPGPSKVAEPVKSAPAETAPVASPAAEPAPVKAPVVQAPAHVSDEVELLNQRLAKINAEREEAAKAERKTAAELKDQEREVKNNQGVYSSRFGELLLLSMHEKEAKVEGVLANLEFSKTKKTLYLVFKDEQGFDSARGAITVAGAPPQLTESELNKLKGRWILIKGKVEKQSTSKGSRPIIAIKTADAITVLP